MNKIICILVLVVMHTCAYAQTDIPKEIGDVDGSVYTKDGKTLYTLQDETVTKWSVNPLKKIDSFKTTVNHLRNYVAEDISISYLDKYRVRPSYKSDVESKISLSEKEDEVIVFSNYIEEHWSLKKKKLTYGNAIGSSMFQPSEIVEFDSSANALQYSYKLQKRRVGKIKNVLDIKLFVDQKPYYELSMNPLFQWYRDFGSPVGELKAFLVGGKSHIEALKYTFEFEDGTEEVHKKIIAEDSDSKAYIVEQYTVYLQRLKRDKRYQNLWHSTTIPDGISEIYHPQSDAFLLSKCTTALDKLVSYNRMEIEREFDHSLKSFTVFARETEYPALFIMNTEGLDTKKKIRIRFWTKKWRVSHGSEAVHMTTVGETKDNQIYKCDTAIPEYQEWN